MSQLNVIYKFWLDSMYMSRHFIQTLIKCLDNLFRGVYAWIYHIDIVYMSCLHVCLAELKNLEGKQKFIIKIIIREDNSLARTIKESMYIRVNNPTLNRNIGKYNLPHIWDNILFSIPELKIK